MYRKYQAKIESAWEILLDCDVKELPVSVCRISEFLGIPVVPYSRGGNLMRKIGVDGIAPKTDGLASYVDNPVIFYNDSLDPDRCRVTVGHEIGHIILRHVGPGTVTVINRPPSPCDNPVEVAANMFCQQLIAPTPILISIGATDNENIEHVCHITRRASKFVISRLRERGSDYIPQSELEKKLSERFSSFIKNF